MNALLDTHTLIWWLSDEGSLSPKAESAIRQARSHIYVSAASSWEIEIKKSLGKIEAPADLLEQIAHHRFIELPVNVNHTLALRKLPNLHRDPFDRILVAQAKVEGLTLITRDDLLFRYGIPCLKA